MIDESNEFDSLAPDDEHMYSWFSLEGQFVLYDVDNPDCWLQSDATIELTEAR